MRKLMCAVALATCAFAGSASAQWAIDGSIGFSAPVGDFGDGLDIGLDLMGGVEYHPLVTGPVRFRGEIGWDRFGVSGGGGHVTIVRVNADAILDIPVPQSRVVPYAIAGLGLYNINLVADNAGSDNAWALGFNLGGGVRYRVGPVEPFFEVRYEFPLNAPSTLSNAPFFPFQFGLRFALPH